MIQAITLPVDGGSYTFPTASVLLQIIEGFGPTDPKTGDHEYSMAHGGQFFSQYYQSRRMTIGGVVKGDDVPSFAANRRQLERALTFNNAEKLMLLTTDDNVALQCNVIPTTKVDLKPLSPVYATWQIELKAEDPIFYSQSSYSLQGGVTTVTGGIVIPVTIPVTLSAALTGALSVVNNGNARVFPTAVTIYGPGTNFIASNKTQGLDFLYNDTLGSTDSVVFDFKRRTATKNGTINVYGLCGGSWWDLTPGATTVTFTVGSGSTGNTTITIAWADGYQGL